MTCLRNNHFLKHMSKLLFSFLCVFSFSMHSQCFEIESILVDGCDGNDEGKNEMVIFKVGSTALNANFLNVSWPNSSNSWLDVCQSASTAQKIAQINATIFACGFLKEPVNGLLPANSKVLLITSTAFNPLAHNFSNLSDTLIVIFQCAGNTAGHFANFGTGIRTLSMNFSPPASCSDAVSYNRASLLMQNGTVGSEDGATVLYTPSGTATYVNYGCQAPYTPLNVDAGPNKIICNNSTQSLSAVASGNYSSVLWSLGNGASGTFSPNNNLNTVYTPGLTDNGTIKLYCSITKSCGTQTTVVKDSLNITVNQTPQPVISANTNSLCSGQSATLSYSLQNATSAGTTSFIWQPGNITTPTISVNATNNYSIALTNTCGTSIATYSLTSYPTPSLSITASGATQLCAGGSVTLTAQSNTGNYLWSNGATTPTISVNTTTTMVATSTNVCGTFSVSQSISVTPNTLNVITTPTHVTCFGTNNGSAEALVTGGTLPYNYNWLPNAATTNSISNLAVGNFTVIVNDANNCTKTQTINITEPTALIASISQTAATCIGNNGVISVSVTGGTSPYSYIWSPTNANTAIVQNLANGNYSVQITDNNNCSISANASLTNSNTISATVNTTSVSCFNGSNGTAQAIVSGGNAPYTYVWQNSSATASTVNNLSAGIYTVSVTDNNSCQATKSFTIIQPSVLNIVANGTTVCANQTISLQASASGGVPPYNYIWDNGTITGTIYTLTANSTKNYSVEVRDNNNCSATDTALVQTANDFNFDFMADVNAGCPTLCVAFRELNPNTSINSWQWNFGDGNSATSQNANHCYSNSGNYNVSLTLTNTQGCSKTISKAQFITVHPKPSADFDASKFEAIIGDSEISFTNLSVNANSAFWNFGDGFNTNIINPTHTFDKEDTYPVTLVAENQFTCKDSITKMIIVRSDFTFYAPNAFSPNEDLLNDVFIPLGTNWDNEKFILRIFNRWGTEIFQTTNTKLGWDGKLKNGEIAKPDVYIWKVELKDMFKHNHKYTGHVSLIK